MIEELPVWDLAAHFGWCDWKDEKFKDAVEELGAKCKNFSEIFTGQLATKLEESIKIYEGIESLKTKISTYISLLYDTDQNNSELLKFKATVEAQLSK